VNRASVRALLLVLSFAGCAKELPPASATPMMVAIAPPPPAPPPAPRLRETPDAPFRHARPELAPVPPFVYPPVQEMRLKNGARVLFTEQQSTPLVTVCLVVSTRGVSLGAGVASLLAGALLDGTKARAQAPLSIALDNENAIARSWAAADAIGVSITAPSTRAEAIATLLAEITLTPSLSESTMLRRRDSVIASRWQTDEIPKAVVERLAPMVLFGADRSVEAPTIDDLRKITRGEILRAYDAVLDPAASTIVVAGNANPSSLMPVLDHAFRSWTRHASRAVPKETPLTVSTSTPRLVVVDRPHALQSHVLLAALARARRAPDVAASSVALGVFGEPAVGRLTRSLKDDGRLAWRIESKIEPLYSGTIATWETDVPSAKTADALRSMDDQLRAMRDGDPTELELDALRDHLVRAEPTWLATTSGIADYLGMIARFDLPTGEPAAYVDRLKTTTAADVRKVASTMFDPARTKLVIVGDWAALKDQLLALGWGPIELRDASGARVRVEPASP